MIKNNRISGVELGYLLGVIDVENLLKFQKALFRTTRGNVFTNYFNIEKNFSLNLKNQGQRSVVFLTF